MMWKGQFERCSQIDNAAYELKKEAHEVDWAII